MIAGLPIASSKQADSAADTEGGNLLSQEAKLTDEFVKYARLTLK